MVEAANVIIYSRDEIDDNLEGIHGCRVVGSLDSSQIAGFVELSNLEIEIDDRLEAFKKRVLTGAVDTLGRHDLQEFVDFLMEKQLFESKYEAEQFFELVARYDDLRTTFWYGVRVTFGNWIDFLSVRKEFRVVSTGKKYNGK